MLSSMVTCSQRAEPVSASALAMACSMAARVLSRVFGPASLVASSSMAAAPASMRPRRACSSRAALMVEWTQMTRYPSAEGYRVIWVHSTIKAARDEHARRGRIEAGAAAIDELATRLAGPKTRLKTRAAIEQAIAKALADTGSARWLQVTID